MLKRHLNWQVTSVAISALVAMPILALLFLSLNPNNGLELWQHLASTVLLDYALSSLTLMFGVAVLTLLLGVSSAYIVTQYRFKGVGFFNWALLLPLAMPAYITAYSYTGLLDVAGPIQNMLRESWGLAYGDYWFPEIRSMGGAIFVLSFVLYPYVYLLARASFLEQSQHLRDVGRILGLNRRQSFIKITLPIACPAIMAGLALTLMETLADFGAVSYFGVNTFTTGIFRTWYGLGSISGAAQLALMLLSFVLLLLALEKNANKHQAFHTKKSKNPAEPEKLHGSKQVLVIFLVFLPLLFGFIIPVTQLLLWAVADNAELFTYRFWSLITNTVTLAALTALLAVALALLISYSHRISQSRVSRVAKKVAGLGYAVPGLVIAVGTLIPLAFLDNSIDSFLRAHMNISSGLLLSGTLVALITAYLVRFLAVAINSVDAGLNSIAPNMDQAARSLGLSPLAVLKKVHLPIINSSVLTALLIVFVDVMKELPATLVLRPFNFNTLAVRAYELAADERLSDAALPSLAIVLVGLLPVILLTKKIRE